jgi:hypothetical protein
MRRLCFVVATVVGVVALSQGAHAQTGSEIPVSGTVTATGSLVYCSAFIGTVSEGTANLTGLGASSIYFETCGEEGLPEPVPVVDSEFSIISAQGSLSGDVSGGVWPFTQEPQGFRFELVLTITDGSGAFVGATGTLSLDGFFSPGAFTATGTIEGTVVLPPRTPLSKADCNKGGWRNLANDEGQPFRSQGQCVSYVVAHRH